MLHGTWSGRKATFTKEATTLSEAPYKADQNFSQLGEDEDLPTDLPGENNLSDAEPEITKAEKDDPATNYRYSSDPKESCGQCRFFEAPGGCERVAGTIRRVDTCNLFQAWNGDAEEHPVPGEGMADLGSEAQTSSNLGPLERLPFQSIKADVERKQSIQRSMQPQRAAEAFHRSYEGRGGIVDRVNPKRLIASVKAFTDVYDDR